MIARRSTSLQIWILLFSLLAAGAAGGWLLHRRTTRYDGLIRSAAERYELDFYLVKALIYEESWFRADARGSAGELGLMQVTMAAAKDYSSRKGFPPLYEARLLEPRLNLDIGCWYLRQSLDHYRNAPQPTLFALLRYNAGEKRADGWLKAAMATAASTEANSEEHFLSAVDYPATRTYARRILRRAESRNFWF